ncbi:unnamed protein product [Peronospora destructor]|uniref:Uncharacterized protein n=1 Tax=Peronospora destructor TaxID=86335 RepID=A0AAV0UA22_9STRA|nr:unnamed protein product [Peronospora destructor]
MEQTNTKHGANISPALRCIKRETISNEMEAQQRIGSLQTRTGMSPSDHNNFFPWVPIPLGQPVVSEAAAPPFNERRLDPLEWIELLEQTECLDYVSPDVEACIEMQSRMEGNQELDLTGTEFISSPAIPKLPSLNTLPVEHPTILKPIAQPQRKVPRRPGLREKFPRQQPLTEYSHRSYIFTAERMVENKRPGRRKSSGARRNSERPPLSASRSLKFEAPQRTKPTSRHKRVSWSGHLPNATTDAPTQRQCKSARKSKDCMIPGCTKATKAEDSVSLTVEVSDARVKDARTPLSRVGFARVMEVARGAVQKDAPRAVKEEDSAVATELAERQISRQKLSSSRHMKTYIIGTQTIPPTV